MTEEELVEKVKSAVYAIVKDWDISTPDYSGYCAGTGTHAETVARAAIAAMREAGWKSHPEVDMAVYSAFTA